MSKKAKVEIIETSNKNVKVGDEFRVNISSEKGSRIGGHSGKTSGGTRKPKKPTLMSVALDLAKDVKEMKNDIEVLKENDKKIFTRLDEIDGKLDGVDNRLNKLEENSN
jgi:hypothetical protein